MVYNTRKSGQYSKRHSVVGIASGYGLDCPGIEFRPGRGGGEIFRTHPDDLWGPPSLLYNGYWLISGGKAAVAWRWLPTPSIAEIKERVEYLCSPSGPSWPVLVWTLPLPLLQTWQAVPNLATICRSGTLQQIKHTVYLKSVGLCYTYNHTTKLKHFIDFSCFVRHSEGWLPTSYTVLTRSWSVTNTNLMRVEALGRRNSCNYISWPLLRIM